MGEFRLFYTLGSAEARAGRPFFRQEWAREPRIGYRQSDAHLIG